MNTAQNDRDQKSIEILAQAVTKAINDSKGDSRFLDISRIPLICLGIANMSADLKEMKDMMASNRRESDIQHESFVTKTEFSPYKNALNKIAGTIIVALVMAILGLVLILNK